MRWQRLVAWLEALGRCGVRARIQLGLGLDAQRCRLFRFGRFVALLLRLFGVLEHVLWYVA